MDRGNRYSFAKFVENESSEHIWDLIVDLWITVFTGYPNIIAHDEGPQFTAKHFQASCSQIGIISKETPTQSQSSLSICERYHSIIRKVYNKLKEDFPTQKKHHRLSLAVHAANNTAGPEGLTSSILVFGAVLRIPLPNIRTYRQVNAYDLKQYANPEKRWILL